LGLMVLLGLNNSAFENDKVTNSKKSILKIIFI